MNTETGRVALMLVALAAVAATRCKPNTPPAPPDVVIIDAGDGGPDDCTAACARLAALSCPEARPTDGGETCGEVCRRVQDASPRAFDLHPACVADAGSVGEVRRCGVRCTP